MQTQIPRPIDFVTEPIDTSKLLQYFNCNEDIGILILTNHESAARPQSA